MLVLHGSWSLDHELILWAEDSRRPVTSRSQAMRSARPHPFAASSEELTEILPGTATQAELHLPSLAKSPLDSPQMVRVTPRAARRSEPGLLRWLVPAAALDTDQGLTWLMGGDPQIEEVRLGASVEYLMRLAGFSQDLVASGRILPTVQEAGTGASFASTSVVAHSRWRPFLHGRDLHTLHGFVRAMPPICRALVGAERGAQALVSDALATWVDARARQELDGRSLLPPRRGRPPMHTPAVEAWLDALVSADPAFTASAGVLAALREALEPWEDLGSGPTGPAHGSFRLSEVLEEPTTGLEISVEDPVDASAPTHARGLPLDPDAVEDPAAETRAAETRAAETPDAATSATWRLEFMLQSTVDPSLVVPAEQVWSDDGTLKRWLDRPQDILLEELGRASRIYPELAAGLRQARPTALELDAAGTVQFLHEVAPRLDEAGFGVHLPTWWDRRADLGLKLNVQTPTDPSASESSRFGRDQLCEFQWQLAIGDHALSQEEIEALAAAKAPLVRLRGQWVSFDPAQLRRGIEFLQREPRGTKPVGEILSLASLADGESLPLDVVDIEAEGWLGDLLAGRPPEALQQVPPPDGLHTTLRPYQHRGLSWLAFLSSVGLGACLADDMGLGKTIQLLALEARDRERSRCGASSDATDHEPSTAPEGELDRAAGLAPSLLLCPMSLIGNWQREAAKFTPGVRVYAHHGGQRAHGEDLHQQLAGVDLVVTSYGTAIRDAEELGEVRWHRVILDEAQAIKNSLSRSARTARGLPADHRVALTGTPVENRLSEMWSIMEFLNTGLLGSQEQFRTRYAIPVERYGMTEVAERLQTVTRPYILRRLKTDAAIIDDLPEKIESKQYCTLTTEQASLYQAVVDDMMSKIEQSEGIERRGHVLAAMAKLKQVCNHPAQLLHDRSAIGRRSGKIERFEEILAEILEAQERVLCFTQFTEFAEMLVPHLASRFGTDVAYLHGGTTKKQRDEMVARFQSGDGPQIFLLSLKAGGTGLNLTAANHVIHLDRWWNPAVEDQATDRAFRIGQKRNVQVHKFICTGTLEEKIDDMLEEKKALANMVVGDGEGWLADLSTDDLRSLLTLSQEDIDE